MAEKRPRYIEKFLSRANDAVDSAMKQGVKRADEILEDALELGKITTAEARKRGMVLREQAKKEGDRIKAGGEKKLNRGMNAAKKITAGRGDALETLAKLDELRKAGIITDAEFKAKKKKLLARI